MSTFLMIDEHYYSGQSLVQCSYGIRYNIIFKGFEWSSHPNAITCCIGEKATKAANTEERKARHRFFIMISSPKRVSCALSLFVSIEYLLFKVFFLKAQRKSTHD